MSPITQELATAYGGLTALATAIIYAGSFASLKRPPKDKASQPNKLIPSDEDEESDDEDELEEYIDSETALWYPVLASVVLLGLWAVIKWLDDPELINLIGSVMFGLTGIGAVYSTANAFVRWALGPTLINKVFPKYNLTLTQGVREVFEWKFHTVSAIIIPSSVLPSILFVLNRPFEFKRFAINGGILAISFGFNALKLVKLESVRTGVYLLVGLFFYDIWWVFGTSVMVDVATTLNLPIKLLWPKNARMTLPGDFVLLGLGDVVVPGFFIAQALRFDQARFLASAPVSRARMPFPKPYFTATLLSYPVALLGTMGIMHYTNHPQPALLYLSPACLLSFFLVAAVRGEVKEAWDWVAERKEAIDPDKLPEAQPIVADGVHAGHAPDTLVPPIDNAAAASGTEDEGTASGVAQKTRTGGKKRRGGQ
ncbi:hypothetical protein M407DRAFT_21319 [Tulasnella calospora MUT 4182]|uniref:Peptidase A22B, signal peptide peptidase n=1 Tax=Tulasnella calospora MUT 4182 TaxID=1051891 RepID=A0A0C3L6U6_9AGAM|nr:hypothetical protein M407DRAFT_21319 [Tulasnella calospora MUT 4182]